MSVYGTVFAVKRFAVHDGDGIRTTLFLKGCPLRCLWCHNPEGLDAKPELAFYAHKCADCGGCAAECPVGAHILDGGHTLDREKCVACGKCVDACPAEALELFGRKISAEDAYAEISEDREFFLASGGGITLSGGEPLMQYEFAAEIFRLAKEDGVNTALDTCGLAKKEAFDAVIPYVDKFLFDVKAADGALHEKLTGCRNDLILNNLAYVDSLGKKTEIRIPLIPGANDGEADAIGKILAGLKNVTAVRVLPYHEYIDTKYEAVGRARPKPFETPNKAMLAAAKNVLEKYGLKVILPDD